MVKIEKEGYGYVSDSAPNAFYRGSTTASVGNRKRRKDEVSNNLVLLNPLVRVFNTTSIDRREREFKSDSHDYNSQTSFLSTNASSSKVLPNEKKNPCTHYTRFKFKFKFKLYKRKNFRRFDHRFVKWF
jgi:hypothetical protein